MHAYTQSHKTGAQSHQKSSVAWSIKRKELLIQCLRDCTDEGAEEVEFLLSTLDEEEVERLRFFGETRSLLHLYLFLPPRRLLFLSRNFLLEMTLVELSLICL